MSDYYRLLGVVAGASGEDIKRAYRRLARRYHPDVNPGDARAESQFKRLTEAYEVLSDPARREEYDRFGNDPSGRSGRGGEGGTGGFSTAFTDLFRSGRAEPTGRPGGDIHATVDLRFEDAIRGLTTRILARRELACSACHGRAAEGERKTRCPTCAGTGKARGGLFKPSGRTCPDCSGLGTRSERSCAGCQGHGTVTLEETLSVRIPPGVDNGSRVRVAGKGHQPRGASGPGDLYVITRVEPHRYLERQGDNLYLRVPITLAEAVLGTKISVPTVDGTATIKVPQGTASGQKFRLSGRGVPSLRGGRAGDQFVEVQVVVPRLKDERSREIMREFARLNRDDPRQGLFD